MEMDAVEKFAEQLAALAEEHNAQELHAYADDLLHAVQNFEISSIQKILGGFNLLSEKIKRMQE